MDNSIKDQIYVQKLKKTYYTKLNRAYTYYNIINSLNNLKLTTKQIELLGFTAIRGTISSPTAKSEFIRVYGSSIDSINNMISKLYKKKLLIKVDSKIKVNPLISPDFANSNIILNIALELNTDINEK